MYFSHKSSRDFLISIGLAVYVIAFDVRLQQIFYAMKLDLPRKFCSNSSKYEQVESSFIKNVCKPLGITGAQFDRILFQHKDEILTMV